MTRIDHAAEAKHLVGATEGRDWNSTSPYADRRIAVALTHATLALAEQQRVANLIALASMAEDDSKHEALAGTLGNEAVWTLATTKMIGLDDEIEVVNPDIAAALGIESTLGAES